VARGSRVTKLGLRLVGARDRASIARPAALRLIDDGSRARCAKLGVDYFRREKRAAARPRGLAAAPFVGSLIRNALFNFC